MKILDDFYEFARDDSVYLRDDLATGHVLTAERNNEIEFALAFMRDTLRKFEASKRPLHNRTFPLGPEGASAPTESVPAHHHVVIPPTVRSGAHPDSSTREDAGRGQVFFLRICEGCGEVRSWGRFSIHTRLGRMAPHGLRCQCGSEDIVEHRAEISLP